MIEKCLIGGIKMSKFEERGGWSASGDVGLHWDVPTTNRDGFPHSDEQAKILNTAQGGFNMSVPLRLSISAVAGSGKTTTVECILKLWANMGLGDRRTIATAFNTHIAKALKEVGTSLKATGLTGFKSLGNSNTANAGGREMIFNYVKSNGMEAVDDRDGNKYRNLSRIQLSMVSELRAKLDYAVSIDERIKNEIAGWMAAARGIEKGVTASMAAGIMWNGVNEPALNVVQLLNGRYGRDDDIQFAKLVLGELDYADAVIAVIGDGMKALNPIMGADGFQWENYARTATADCVVPNSVTGYYSNRELVSVRELLNPSKYNQGASVFNLLGMRFGGGKIAVAFADHIYAPVALGLRSKPADLLIVDEVQDFSILQGRFLDCFIGPNTNLVIVGDIRQSLYLFNHADSAATRKLVKTFNCIEMPMTICWRNSNLVGKEVHAFMATNISKAEAKGYTMEMLEEAGIGDYSAHKTPSGDWREGQASVRLPAHLLPYAAEHGDLVTCRVNAPLTKLALRTLIDGEKSITLPGGSGGIDKTVMKVVKGNQAYRGAWNGFDLFFDHGRISTAVIDHDLVDDRLRGYLDSNLDAAERRCGGDRVAAKREQRYCDLADMADATAEILHGYIGRVESPVMNQFESWLSQLCGTTEGREGHEDTIRFASVHRTKGAQGPTAFVVVDKVHEDGVIDTFMLKHCMKDTPEVNQELNACYVAVTRAINRVVFVSFEQTLAEQYPTWDSYQSVWNDEAIE